MIPTRQSLWHCVRPTLLAGFAVLGVGCGPGSTGDPPAEDSVGSNPATTGAGETTPGTDATLESSSETGTGPGSDSGSGSDSGESETTSSDDTGPTLPDGSGDELWDALYAAALPEPDQATRWVAVDGNDNAPCTEEQPCATIFRALQTVEPGGLLVVRDGHYVNRLGMRVNDNTSEGSDEHFGVAVPSGLGPDARTVIRAETRFGVRLTFDDTSLAWANEWIRLRDAEYVWVDGFIVDWLGQGSDPAFMVALGRRNILTRCILRRDAVDDYGGMVAMGADDSQSLIQDVHGVGGGRYMVQTGPGTMGPGGRGIVRRAVFRFDFAGSNQPLATFSHYGNNDGDGSQGALFQNSIAIDGPNIDTGLGQYSYKWGSYYNPKNALDVRYQGAMSIADGGRSGLWVNDNIGSPRTEVEDALVVGGDLGSGLRVSAGTSRVSRSTFANTGTCLVGDGVEDLGSECFAELPEQLIGRSEGAQVSFAYGRFLSVWGEDGYDEPTEVPLWPFPYESVIQSVFAEPLSPPPGYTPETNDTERGFCGGTSVEGLPMTLTRYIHELGGAPTPADVYGHR